MGATNTFRVLGSRFGTIVMVADMLKGMIAVALFNFLPHYLHNELGPDKSYDRVRLAAVAGHIFPIWAQFQGRQRSRYFIWNGTRHSAYCCCLLCCSFYSCVLYITRYVSLSSILAGVALPICVLWIYNEKEIILPGICRCCCMLGCSYSSKKY